MDSHLAELGAEMATEAEGRLRDILLEIRDGHRKAPRYVLMSSMDIQTERTEKGWRVTVSQRVWPSDDIPKGFHGTALELTPEALARSFPYLTSPSPEK